MEKRKLDMLLKLLEEYTKEVCPSKGGSCPCDCEYNAGGDECMLYSLINKLL